MTTVLAYTSPAAGHLFPLVPGLQELRRRGCAVHVRTAAELLPAVRAAGSTPPRSTRGSRRSRSPTTLASGGTDRLKKGFEDDPPPRPPRRRRPARRHRRETQPDLLLIDTLAYGAGVAAERSGLPWAMTLPSLLPLRGRGIPPYGLGLAPRHDLLGRARDAIGWRLVERLYGAALLPRLNELRTEAGLAPSRSPLELFDAPDRVLALTGAPLEYPRDDLPPHVRLVGARSVMATPGDGGDHARVARRARRPVGARDLLDRVPGRRAAGGDGDRGVARRAAARARDARGRRRRPAAGAPARGERPGRAVRAARPGAGAGGGGRLPRRDGDRAEDGRRRRPARRGPVRARPAGGRPPRRRMRAPACSLPAAQAVTDACCVRPSTTRWPPRGGAAAAAEVARAAARRDSRTRSKRCARDRSAGRIGGWAGRC